MVNERIRQRLVGAVVLVALALILWPLVMSPQRDQSFVIESDLPQAPEPEPSIIEEPRPREDVSPVGDYQEKINEEAPSLDKAGLPVAWLVQVGSFGNRDNAVKLVERLKGDGYRAQIREQTSQKGTLNRVVVGPYVDKYMAQRDRNKIAAKYALQPAVMRFKP
jgi:DedD protein